MKNSSRRQFVGGAAALAGSAALPTSVFALAGANTGLTPLDMFVRMRCGVPGERTWWWYTGHVLGRQHGSPAKPMLSVTGCSYSTSTTLEDGAVRYELKEAGYYGDPVTTEIVDRWVNPLNGVECEAVHYLSGQRILFRPDLTVVPDVTLPDGLDYTGRIIGPDIKHGRIWMAEELFVGLPTESGPQRTANSLANFEAELSQVTDPDLAFVPTTMEYTTINSFRPWMAMGDTPGTMSMRLNGVKLRTHDGVPAPLRVRIEKDHPGFFDPA